MYNSADNIICDRYLLALGYVIVNKVRLKHKLAVLLLSFQWMVNLLKNN